MGPNPIWLLSLKEEEIWTFKETSLPLEGAQQEQSD